MLRRRRRHGIQVKTAEQVELMRAAGLLVGETLEMLREAVKPGITTMDLDVLAEQHIRDHGGVPSFKGYHGFPATICTSVNEEIVHGIPERRPGAAGRGRALHRLRRDRGGLARRLGDHRPGGEITPEEARLLEVTEASLWHGLAAGTAGARLTNMSHAIESHIRSQGPTASSRGTGGTASGRGCTWTR